MGHTKWSLINRKHETVEGRLNRLIEEQAEPAIVREQHDRLLTMLRKTSYTPAWARVPLARDYFTQWHQ